MIPKVVQPAAKHYSVVRPPTKQYKDVTPGRSVATALRARRPVSLPVLRQPGLTGASDCRCASGGACSCPGKGSGECSSRGQCCTGLSEHRNALPHVPVQARAASRGSDPRLASFPGVPYGSPDAIVPLHLTGMRCLSWTRVLYTLSEIEWRALVACYNFADYSWQLRPRGRGCDPYLSDFEDCRLEAYIDALAECVSGNPHLRNLVWDDVNLRQLATLRFHGEYPPDHLTRPICARWQYLWDTGLDLRRDYWPRSLPFP